MMWNPKPTSYGAESRCEILRGTESSYRHSVIVFHHSNNKLETGAMVFLLTSDGQFDAPIY